MRAEDLTPGAAGLARAGPVTHPASSGPGQLGGVDRRIRDSADEVAGSAYAIEDQPDRLGRHGARNAGSRNASRHAKRRPPRHRSTQSVARLVNATGRIAGAGRADLLRGCRQRRLRSAISACPPLRLWGSSASRVR